ncbi:ankyrin repeat domain-containing protein [Paenibacillus thermotolerans]|uniref:ankyrin repeat domain-containing protein n=1 Tax=Paenibacillus thermotolerans TaxID=3027807 RepID=UPI00236820EB|nr:MULTISPECIES: ankyrin repeat domain-containing protein [unclassified Paenibacillus]
MEQTLLIDELFQAAQSGDAARLKELLSAHPHLANAENGDGLTPLGYAAHFGRKEAVEALLDFGADVNAMSHSKLTFIPSNTALHAAIAGERSMEVIKLLLSRNANTAMYDSNGHTPLHTAAFHDDNVELIRLLLEHGADVNGKPESGEPPLAVALRQGNHTVAAFLRQNGAQE